MIARLSSNYPSMVPLNKMYYSDSASVKEKLSIAKYYGFNTGNIIWYEAIMRSIAHSNIKDWLDLCDNDKHSMVIIPTANAIRVNFDWGILAEQVEKYDLRTTMLGLGAHLTDELNTPKKLINALSNKTIKALQVISSHSVSIGVRGAMTAECLDLLGIQNYRIIGCPSFFLNPRIVDRIYKFPNNGLETSNISISIYGLKRYENARFINMLKRSSMFNRSYFVMQTMHELPMTKYESKIVEEKHLRYYFPGAEFTAAEWNTYLKQNSYIFFDFDEWLSFFNSKSIKYAVGSRFHGNMAALLAGVPALWLAHDARMVELCELMKLPYVSLSEINNYIYIEDIFDVIDYNFVFYKNYQFLYRQYLDFLTENSIQYIQPTTENKGG